MRVASKSISKAKPESGSPASALGAIASPLLEKIQSQSLSDIYSIVHNNPNKPRWDDVRRMIFEFLEEFKEGKSAFERTEKTGALYLELYIGSNIGYAKDSLLLSYILAEDYGHKKTAENIGRQYLKFCMESLSYDSYTSDGEFENKHYDLDSARRILEFIEKSRIPWSQNEIEVARAAAFDTLKAAEEQARSSSKPDPLPSPAPWPPFGRPSAL